MAPPDPRPRPCWLAVERRLSPHLDPAPPTPVMVVDLDAFDANADDLVRRARASRSGSPPSRCGCPTLLRRALARAGFQGVLSFTLREALWLYEQGISDDLVVAYPTVDRERARAAGGLARRGRARSR